MVKGWAWDESCRFGHLGFDSALGVFLNYLIHGSGEWGWVNLFVKAIGLHWLGFFVY
jgi:hypothetical protein